MEEKKTFGERCKDGLTRHKRKIMIGGAVVLVAVGGYLMVKQSDEILEFFSGLCDGKNLKNVADETIEIVSSTPEIIPFELVEGTRDVEVVPHLMRLPIGRHASESAKAYARELDVVLPDGMTMRHGCTRTIAA